MYALVGTTFVNMYVYMSHIKISENNSETVDLSTDVFKANFLLFPSLVTSSFYL